MRASPLITVFMPVYNGLKYLPEAVESILGQTHPDFEFLIIDDGSTDGSLEYLRNLTDPRIRLITQPQNIGLRANYNCGLAEASGRYIAIMDQDDIAMPMRLKLQWDFMEAHPDVGLCGGKAEIFGVRNEPPWVSYFGHDELRVALLFENPICHPSVMLRAAVLREHGLDYPENPFAEEYLLWTKIAAHSHLANLQDVLLRYRTHPQQVSSAKSAIQTNSANRVARQLLATIGIDPSNRELAVHNMLGLGFNPYLGHPRDLRSWCDRLIAANKVHQVYPDSVLSSQLDIRLKNSCQRQQTVLAGMSVIRRLHWILSATGRNLLG